MFEPKLTKAQRQERVREIMAAVGLVPEMINRYPHEFSGGQAQRIGIARAVVTRPKLIVCDEPVSALAVSIQGQVITLLRKLRKEFGLTLIFISHDLSVVRLISDDVLVLYLGKVVEAGDAATVFDHPAHPYTQALVLSRAHPDPKLARGRGTHPLAGGSALAAQPAARLRLLAALLEGDGYLQDQDAADRAGSPRPGCGVLSYGQAVKAPRGGRRTPPSTLLSAAASAYAAAKRNAGGSLGRAFSIDRRMHGGTVASRRRTSAQGFLPATPSTRPGMPALACPPVSPSIISPRSAMTQCPTRCWIS